MLLLFRLLTIFSIVPAIRHPSSEVSFFFDLCFSFDFFQLWLTIFDSTQATNFRPRFVGFRLCVPRLHNRFVNDYTDKMYTITTFAPVAFGILAQLAALAVVVCSLGFAGMLRS